MPICYKRTKNSSKEPFEWGDISSSNTFGFDPVVFFFFFIFFYVGLENTAPLKIGKPDRHVLEKAYRLFIGLGIWLNNIKFKTAKIWLKQHGQFLALYNQLTIAMWIKSALLNLMSVWLCLFHFPPLLRSPHLTKINFTCWISNSINCSQQIARVDISHSPYKGILFFVPLPIYWSTWQFTYAFLLKYY